MPGAGPVNKICASHTNILQTTWDRANKIIRLQRGKAVIKDVWVMKAYVSLIHWLEARPQIQQQQKKSTFGDYVVLGWQRCH